MKKFSGLFPEDIGNIKSANLFKFGLRELKKISDNRNFKICIKKQVTNKKDLLFKELKEIPEEGMNSKKVIKDIVKFFFNNVPNWRNRKNQYNICSPTNVTSVALAGLAQEYNVHNINSDFSGDCLLAEKVISNMMANLIGKNTSKVRGIFSFGGTASNLYAMKIALNKVFPKIGKTGIPKKVCMLITEDSHFSHRTVADWLGIGTDRLIVIKSDKEGRSIIKDAEKKFEKKIQQGNIIAGFILNGGPFYNFAVDDIKGFIKLRKKLIKKYHLGYTPHIHVDSVIGWVWLMFKDYDFQKNRLKIKKEVLSLIIKQMRRVSQIRLADSWGVDFHKGIGGAPTPAGMFISNNAKDLILLSKKFRGICNTHHLGGYWASDDPSDITLETSRSAAPALATLGSLLTIGKNGFRSLLAKQMESTIYLRNNVSKNTPFISANDNALGFNTMIVLAKKDIFGNKKRTFNNLKKILESDEDLLNKLNKTLKSFYEWCNQHEPLGCSFSNSFYKTKNGNSLSGLKYCIVSPHTNKKVIRSEILKLKRKFKQYEYERRKF
ncbi:hypothetical protein GYA25_03065 [Candidatus Woesearchaeota archaeon]|nr:hypothetical protein [Candidatus Woesearchaeota archaeon]